MLYKLSPMQKHSETNFDSVIKIVKVNLRSSYEILLVLEYPMLYTKFQSHRPLSSEEKYFEIFHHNLHGHGHVTWNI